MSAEKILRSAKHYCVLQVKTTPFSELSPYLELKLKLAAAISMPYITPWRIPKDTAKAALQTIRSKHVVLCGSNSTVERATGVGLEFLGFSPSCSSC